MFIHYNTDGTISTISDTESERSIVATDFFLEIINQDPTAISLYRVSEGRLTSSKLFYLPKIKFWEQADLLSNDWLTTVEIKQDEILINVNEDHPSAKLLIDSGLKIYFTHDDILIDSCAFKSRVLQIADRCKYFNHDDIRVCSYVIGEHTYQIRG